MPIDKTTTLSNLKESSAEISKLKGTFESISADEVFGTSENRAILQMLIHACDYLNVNIAKLRDRIRVTNA